MSESQWKQFVELYGQKNQHLSHKQVLQMAKKPFQQLKQHFSQKGGEQITINGKSYNVDNGLLDLSDKGIGDKGVRELTEQLEGNTSIHTINLESNEIGVFGCDVLTRFLENNTSIKRIGLRNNDLGYKCALSLANMLEKNKAITFMDISSNYFDDASANILLYALKHNDTIEEINITGNNISEKRCYYKKSKLLFNIL